ncbi:YDG domain-containing protein, partial [Hymenobacter glacialis]|uniref:YDG domain-containing protein n=1 Tax=Hymenobacter glacialis TaxID=1908236 RepID=UPI0019D3D5E4
MIAKAVTVAGVTAQNKAYDGGLAASLNTASATLTGVVSGESVTLTSTATATPSVPAAAFASKNVADGLAVTVTGLGLSSTNYALTQPTGLTANITAKALTIALTDAGKQYDGNTTAAGATAILATTSGLVTGDDVTVSASNGVYSSKNVGSRTVTADVAKAGADAGNYTANTSATTTASITAKALTIALNPANKEYDGTRTVASPSAFLDAATSGLVANDKVEVSASNGTFDTKRVGTGKTVTATVAINAPNATTNVDAGNYSLANVNASATNAASYITA